MFASAPAVPDYRGAAEAQSGASQWLAQFQTAANRPNIRTPWGSMTWSRGGAGGSGPAAGAAANPYLSRFAGGADAGGPAGVGGYAGAGDMSYGDFAGGDAKADFGARATQAGRGYTTGTPSEPPFAGGDAKADFGARAMQAGRGYTTGTPSEPPDADQSANVYNYDRGGVTGAIGIDPTTGQPVGTAAGGTGQRSDYPGEPGYAGGGYGPDYSSDPYAAGGGWEMNIELTPAEQAALEAQQRIGSRRSGIAESLLGDVAREQGPLDLSGLPGLDTGETAREKAYQATYGRMSSRLDPQWDRREQQTRAQLMSQGLKPGDESYDTQMAQFQRDRNDAYQQAQESATQLGEQAAAGTFQRGLGGRQQALGELLQRRGWSLNQVNALLGGQQVQQPSFPGFAQAGAGQAPNYMGAAQAGYQGQLDAYSIQQALMASLLGGGASLGAAYLGR